jgi:hypothetical protein
VCTATKLISHSVCLKTFAPNRATAAAAEMIKIHESASHELAEGRNFKCLSRQIFLESESSFRHQKLLYFLNINMYHLLTRRENERTRDRVKKQHLARTLFVIFLHSQFVYTHSEINIAVEGVFYMPFYDSPVCKYVRFTCT